MDKSGESALGQTVCTEIIVCKIALLVQLKGVKGCTEWLALEFLIETTWQQHLFFCFFTCFLFPSFTWNKCGALFDQVFWSCTSLTPGCIKDRLCSGVVVWPLCFVIPHGKWHLSEFYMSYFPPCSLKYSWDSPQDLGQVKEDKLCWWWGMQGQS